MALKPQTADCIHELALVHEKVSQRARIQLHRRASVRDWTARLAVLAMGTVENGARCVSTCRGLLRIRGGRLHGIIVHSEPEVVPQEFAGMPHV